jgi:hypothetical protein
LALILSWDLTGVAALTDADCRACHGPGHPTAVGASGRVAPLVEPTVLAHAAHAGLGCVECHPTTGVPHVEPPQTVACHSCHQPQGSTLAASVHGTAPAADGSSVRCTDCHGGHEVMSAAAARSGPGKARTAAHCARCHGEVAGVYQASVHGKALAAGIAESPTCTDCHGEHGIAAVSEPTSSVAPRNIPGTCSACHDEERLATRLGLPAGRLATYLDSYHGVVNRYGEAAVANCATCHGVHDIRPSSDTLSSIHPRNLGRTCGTCHPGAGDGLAGARVHVAADPGSSKGMYYVRVFYTLLTVGLMACFVAYMGIEIYGTWRRRRR